MNNNKKILLLGSNGLLGSTLKNIIEKKNNTLTTIARKHADYKFDLKDFRQLKKVISANSYDVVINCAAYINFEFCEKNKKKIFLINALLPKYLSNLSKLYAFKLIHISSDAIYTSTTKNKINTENAKTGHVNAYAKSKFYAEKYCKKYKKNLIIRTNFVDYNQKSFIHWAYKKLKDEKQLILYNDMFTSTLDVKYCSNIILQMIENNLSGTYNLGSKDSISKKDFIVKLAKVLGHNCNFLETSVKANKIKKSCNLGLNVYKIEKKLNINMKDSKSVISTIAKNVRSRN